jgi:hypothetical protein
VPVTLAASLALAVGVGWWWWARETSAVPDIVAEVELVEGDVRVEGASEPGSEAYRRVEVGTALSAGDRLATPVAGDGAPVRLALLWAAGQSVRLDSDTRIRLASAERVELQRGAIYVDSGALFLRDGSLAVGTEFGKVLEVGTQFEVRVLGGKGGALRVRVRDGAVAVVEAGQSHSAEAGEELTVRSDGSVGRSTVERYGSAWEWVVAAAPSIDIEGLFLARAFFLAIFSAGFRTRPAGGSGMPRRSSLNRRRRSSSTGP